MRLGSAEVIRADARSLPIADNSVDLIVTSPPYLNLRSYQDSGSHYSGQIGSEASQSEFLDALLEVTRECIRVAKPTASIFVNLGDSYRDKGLQLTPHRYAARCVDELGLILRAEICWSKPNGLPESVTDRVRRSHEMFFHFTLEPRYFSAVDEIREESQQERPQAKRAEVLAARAGLTDAHRAALKARGLGDVGRGAATQDGTGKNTSDVLRLAAEADAALGGYTREFLLNGPALGKLPGSVWTVPTEPLRVPDHLGIDHFAAFPTEWPKRIIAGWSPAGVCVECGEGRRPVVDKVLAVIDRGAVGSRDSKFRGSHDAHQHNRMGQERVYGNTEATITGYACACPAPTADTTPGVILDPFGGTGTVALVAKALGRHGITVDMSADYCRLAAWRTNDRDQLGKVLGVDKAPPVHEDEQSLFTLEEPA